MEPLLKTLAQWLRITIALWADNSYWMAWNLFLAIVPLGIAAWLFRHRPARSPRSPLWWGLAIMFILFLPNAPYVLTDLIHLVNDIRYRYTSLWATVMIVIPQYVLFVAVGFGAYVWSLVWLDGWLRAIGRSRWIPPMEQLLHGLSAVGVFVGRFWRFNSWDLFTQPHTLLERMANDLAAHRPALVIGLIWGVLAGLYGLLKPFAIGYGLYRQQQHQPDRPSSPGQL
ncbi:DUF1361 domain-containing protein [Limnothrix sp. FACHB-1083]|uniref:DUF1361 domain-containing protein n=1 Tax=unclassified Limnothrix TaxID=2632864 RepID=UPI001680E88C|nr:MULTISPECIES: DUF1361 domain-containing protein [unclassified Limnothrix]MBD2162398.1 DUF1361 domain-containing protein [Limnothrix sp. FACHB-1083]MBD2193377.1 DUF1361 domain-containing protein [Limnothrix sp. FACHB-1088]